MTDDEKDFWDTLVYGVPLYELYSVNVFKHDEKRIDVYGYINIKNKKDFKVRVCIDLVDLDEKNDFVCYPCTLGPRDAYPTSCRVSIIRPIRFECEIILSM